MKSPQQKAKERPTETAVSVAAIVLLLATFGIHVREDQAQAGLALFAVLAPVVTAIVTWYRKNHPA